MGRQVERLLGLASFLAAVYTAIGATYLNSTNDPLDALDARLDRLTSRAITLLNQVDKRMDRKQIANGILFMNRILRLQGNNNYIEWDYGRAFISEKQSKNAYISIVLVNVRIPHINFGDIRSINSQQYVNLV